MSQAQIVVREHIQLSDAEILQAIKLSSMGQVDGIAQKCDDILTLIKSQTTIKSQIQQLTAQVADESADIDQRLIKCAELESRNKEMLSNAIFLEDAICCIDKAMSDYSISSGWSQYDHADVAAVDNIHAFEAVQFINELKAAPVQPYADSNDSDAIQKKYAQNMKTIVSNVNPRSIQQFYNSVSGVTVDFTRHKLINAIKVRDFDVVDERLAELFDTDNKLVCAIMSKMINKFVNNFGFVTGPEEMIKALSWLIENNCVKHYLKLVGDAMKKSISDAETEQALQLCAKACIKRLQQLQQNKK